jgi:signal transduction histidine kinase
MQRLIEDLLSYSRSHTEAIHKEEIDLNLVLKELVDSYSETASDKTVEMSKLPIVKGMKFQIIQLFDNLLNNSIKYRQENIPLIIKIVCTPIKGKQIMSLGGDESTNYYHIQFSDNGIGFESKYSKKIFELFQRLQGKNDYPGTGIGLSICKKIIENHDGFISAEGIPGIGSVFHIYLPVFKE